MVSTVSNQGYASPTWNTGRDWAPPAWGVEAFLLRLLNSRVIWIGLMILGFIAWWPIGLALLLFLIGSGRMGCGHFRRYGGRHGSDERGRGWQGWAGPWAGCGADNEERAQRTSGNRAFDEYRADTLRRLEEEQREFSAFLDRLRFAKDKAEFDAFMNARRQSPPPSDAPPADPAV